MLEINLKVNKFKYKSMFTKAKSLSGNQIQNFTLKIMKVKQFVLVLFLIIASVISLEAQNPKDFTVESAFGNSKFTLSKNEGKIVVLHFLLKTECPYCLRHTHEYSVLASTMPDIIQLFLKPDSMEEIRAWVGKISKEGLSELPMIYRDTEAKLASQYGIPDGYHFHGQVVHYPAMVVLDAHGKELFRYIGKDNTDRLSVNDFTKKMKELK